MIQHKALITKIQRLMEDRHLHNERDLGEGIAYLTDYVFEHFTLEESVMLKTNYPGFEEHRDEHSYYVKYIFNLKRQVVLTPEIIDDFESKLNEWFIEHILKTDVKMSAYLRQYCNDNLF
jgi:hemerythrin